jgi:hypothetical protein
VWDAGGMEQGPRNPWPGERFAYTHNCGVGYDEVPDKEAASRVIRSSALTRQARSKPNPSICQLCDCPSEPQCLGCKITMWS